MSTKIPPDCAEKVTKKPGQQSASLGLPSITGMVLTSRILLVNAVSFYGMDLAERAVVSELLCCTVRLIICQVSVCQKASGCMIPTSSRKWDQKFQVRSRLRLLDNLLSGEDLRRDGLLTHNMLATCQRDGGKQEEEHLPSPSPNLAGSTVRAWLWPWK